MFREDAANTASSASSSGAGTIAASLAAIGSVLAASICCLPLFPFVLAAGLAGTSGFLTEIRPYLLAGSVFFIALGFYQVRRARKCRRRTGIVASVLLWLSAGFVLISIFLPQIIANVIAGPGTR
jgi:positive regulator of sigma E activity